MSTFLTELPGPLTVTAASGLAAGAMRWCVDHLDVFDPFANDNGTPDVFRAKALTELSLVCAYGLGAVPNDLTRQRIHECASFARQVWDDPRYYEKLMSEPGMFRLWGSTFIALRKYYPDDTGLAAYEPLLDSVIAERYATTGENVPFRALELRHLLDQRAAGEALPSYQELFGHTILGRRPSLIRLTDLDAYSVTHTLFYITDFGRRGSGCIPSSCYNDACTIVKCLLGRYLRRGNLDLVAELLIGCLCLQWQPLILHDAAWTALTNAQSADGSVPGPDLSTEQLARLGATTGDDTFNRNYHTTLVSALAAFLALEQLLGTAEP